MRSEQSGTADAPGRQDRDVEERLRAFLKRHGDGVVAVINHVGRVGARIVVIAPDGEFGDALASSVDAASAICGRLGLPVREWDRETTGLLAPSQADRIEMGTRRR